VYYQYDAELNKFIHAPNTIYKHRSEGIATTYKGLFGVNAISDVTKIDKNKIVIWGDSYVEAHQVDDHFKIAQVVSKNISQKELEEQLMCFGVGMSGDSVADYYFDIPKYEKIIPGIKAHFIIITDIKDTIPDQTTDTIRGVFKSSPLRLYQVKWSPEFQQVKMALNNFRMYFIWEPVRSFISSVKEIKFLPSGRVQSRKISSSSQVEYSDKFLKDSWSFLFEKLSEQTKLPIIFVYCPVVPRISNGKILFEDDSNKQFLIFSELAAVYNMPVINMANDFTIFYRDFRLFPRGFLNSKPSNGHFNEHGHRIVAERITNYVIAGGGI
jgi:hypothetical protein